MYAPGTRRHIKNAVSIGATVQEFMEVLKLCVVEGVQACNLGVPILAEELAQLSSAGEPAGSQEGALFRYVIYITDRAVTQHDSSPSHVCLCSQPVFALEVQ